jgi:hypothetical protein
MKFLANFLSVASFWPNVSPVAVLRKVSHISYVGKLGSKGAGLRLGALFFGLPSSVMTRPV